MKKRVAAAALGAALCLTLGGCAEGGARPAFRPQPAEETPETVGADIAQATLDKMSTEEKVGQLFLIRCPRQRAEELTAAYKPGGVLLFAENVAGETPASLRARVAALDAAAGTPLLVAADEEGGEVNRLSLFPAFRHEPFAAPAKVYLRGGWRALRRDTAEKCALLLASGVNVNLAPVCDVCADASEYMYARSFDGDAETVAEFARRSVRDYAEGGVGCVLKHFPGYGGNADTHTGVARDTRTLAELEGRDLLPFAAGIEAGAQAILISHTVVDCLDATLPASLSPSVHDYLRGELGFAGVAVTDDLTMSAVRQFCGCGEAAVLAVLAGNDLLCSSDYTVQIPAVLEAVESGHISMERIDEAALRVLRWKAALGLLG